VLTEMTVACNGQDDYTLITAAVAQWHDREWLERWLPAGLSLRDRTRELSTLIVTGPKSRDLFAALSDADLSRPWLSHEMCTVVGRQAVLARVSFAGELGWEVHAATGDIPAIHDAILDAGATSFGMWALDSLRLEKAYRAWKGDLSTDYSLLEAGLDRFVRFDKPQDFPGKAALLAERQRGLRKRFAVLTVEAGEADAPPMSTIWHDGRVVGEATSGGWGYRVGASIALAVLRADLAAPGTAVEVEIYGEMRPAVVRGDGALWDPENARLKA
jgi:dimethylglycine dehydrogenase